MLRRWPGLLAPAVIRRWRALLSAQSAGSLRLAQALDLDEVLHELRALRPELPTCVLVGQCWVRRAQPAHHWHQDGALQHDFIAEPGGAPLAMLTVWIPLVPCGVDAPGLAWVQPSLDRLLPPSELSEERVLARFGAAAVERPALAAGEGVLFDGGLLHRTHCTSAMKRPRTSIELRFVDPGTLPARLSREPLIDVAGAQRPRVFRAYPSSAPEGAQCPIQAQSTAHSSGHGEHLQRGLSA